MWKSDVFSSYKDRLRVRLNGCSEGGSFFLIGITENATEKEIYRIDISGTFKIDYEFDPVSLAIYEGVKEFYAEVSGECRIDKWSVEDIEDEKVTAYDDECFVSNGLVSVMREDGSEIRVSVIPKKTLFVGNSILLGMFSSYGMCASDKNHDYASLIAAKILELSPTSTFSRLYASPFEHSESTEAFDEWFYNSINPTTEKESFKSFESDLDLIVFQLMDNVNTPEKKEAFKKNMPELLRRVKGLSPNARIIWVYGWFMKRDIVDFIKQTCSDWKIESLDISSAHKKENYAKSGQISINPEGEEIVVKDTWITHPGNDGMAEIAKMLTKKILG
ncbi:MAG: hypothetical protein E7673_07425 [Ruminococcaceae bacterium]|nr:hypothetical protein [Oscillospiraceae bacterium]